jgi:hypothetical protein
MAKRTRKKASGKFTTVRPPTGLEAMHLAALHMTCLNLEYTATRIYANAPERMNDVAAILRDAATKLRDFTFGPVIDCQDGFKDCDGTCLPKSDPCPPFAEY